jgi:hypothetical protein
MNETNVVAAILTVGFYSGRGAAMSLPQVIATYDEMQALLLERQPKKGKSKKRKAKKRKR